MDSETHALLKALLAQPVAALGTLHEGAPFVSMVPGIVAPDGSGFLIHVSRLAQHTRDLLADDRMSLLFMTPLTDQEPLALPRVTLTGRAERLEDAGQASAADAYLARFPQAELTLGLGDFTFFRLRPEAGRLVAGFGRAHSLTGADILAAWR